jgi:hypothetical protein
MSYPEAPKGWTYDGDADELYPIPVMLMKQDAQPAAHQIPHERRDPEPETIPPVEAYEADLDSDVDVIEDDDEDEGEYELEDDVDGNK